MSRILIVTGGSRGIGAATARLAAAEGYTVCLTYLRSREAADAVVRGIAEAGGKAMSIAADVSKEADVVRLFDHVDSDLGPVSALVNNAGILEQQMRVEDMDAERLARVFSTNIIGSFLCAREAVRRMSTRRGGNGGVIVNLSSMAARLGSPNEYVDYAASKGAIDTFTLGLAKEVAAEGIRVNAVRPGLIYSDIHAAGGMPDRVDRLKHTVPMQRGGYPEEVARAILWLLSDDASYSTGTFVDVAGGR
jgi:NAD(P)-dependent dehydrogenase (short-subunit alcohol dehydrogenase family)